MEIKHCSDALIKINLILFEHNQDSAAVTSELLTDYFN